MSARLEQIQPTLFIGLGGAGGHVLSILKSLFRREYESVMEETKHNSPLQFLLLDTDDFEKLPRNVQNNLGEREQDFVSLSHFNPRRYAAAQLSMKDSDLHRWFDRKALPYVEDAVIHDGASRLRMLGRLCLHYHYSLVEQRIREKLDRAMDADVHTQATRIKPEPRPLRIFIVTSSCGGTGSGIMLDVAAMVSRLVRDRGMSPDMQSFVFLPFPFIEKNAQIDPALESFYQHNAWAFFDELNYFLLDPSRVAEYTLDPQRRFGEPARPAGTYGLDLFRTVYLVGNQIPSVGTLDMPDQLYSYVANGIFHVFLTPEEGELQSHYSNIKAKLQDRDQVFGLVKRFASFGYAEYRSRGEDHLTDMVDNVVAGDWQAAIGTAMPDAGVAAEAESIMDAVLSKADAVKSQLRNWSPRNILPAANIVGSGVQPAKTRAALGQLPQGYDVEVETALASHAGALQDVVDSLRAEVQQRLFDPAYGLLRSSQLLQALESRLGQQAANRMETVPPEPLANDPAVAAALQQLLDRQPLPRRRFLVAGQQGVGARTLKAYATEVSAFAGDLHKGALRRLAALAECRLGEMLDAAASELQAARSGAALVEGAMKRVPPSGKGAGSRQRSPTIQDVPPERVSGNGAFRDAMGQFREAAQAAIAHERAAEGRRLITEPSDTAAADYLSALHRIWHAEARRRHRSRSVLDWMKEWAEYVWKDQGLAKNGTSASSAEETESQLLSRIYPLAMPALPLDHASLHKMDTAPEITVTVAPYSDADTAYHSMRLPGKPAFISNEHAPERIAVLRTKYAFSSRAIDGMETLRRSYRERDRRNSLPHIHGPWNDAGLDGHADNSMSFERHELLHLARAFALSRACGSGAEQPFPGIQLRRDARDQEPIFLVRQAAKGEAAVECRHFRAVHGHEATWEVLYQLNGSVRYGKAGAQENLPSVFAAYLGSECRRNHQHFLAALQALEMEPAHRDAYLTLYASYCEWLQVLIAGERDARRNRDVALLSGLLDVLFEYMNHMQPPDGPLLV
jgi:hypothetical protein